MRLPGRVNFAQQGEMGSIRCAIHGVTVEGDDVVRVLRRIGQGSLPQAGWV
jgi:hypothetical protein